MKILLPVLLVLNFLVEALAAITLIGGPEGVAAAGQGGQWSMHYGFAALAIASVSLWTWPYRGNLPVITVVLGVLLVFHTGLAVSLTLAGDQAAGRAIHVVLAALCLLLFVRRRRCCS
jgi:hypothetical protein